ncbi:MAG: hypothetical protein UT30_C0016G0009 [Candidatus Uhrbacteria bacterium GW2011_GWF2_39_13]|uniref:Secreted protein n=1 Tax=Candidatus Uhrbacteria bacterium GW2011_GWF2_39_13 TaxID=1618995 RepID=A0A0G0MLA4_9BACT|nr:MAG: hypothetical protein UT30_C0016G0009 [Candidatus Uhrbacteria bacterium GW2011_GWF2_39_13]HAU66473.1 hypothetical protein [Candidatus Uhrbacteria bacterium]
MRKWFVACCVLLFTISISVQAAPDRGQKTSSSKIAGTFSQEGDEQTKKGTWSWNSDRVEQICEESRLSDGDFFGTLLCGFWTTHTEARVK